MNNTLETNDEISRDIPNIDKLVGAAAETGQKVASQVSEKMTETVHAVRDLTDRAATAVKDGYEKVTEKAGDAYKQGRKAAGRWEQSLEDSIQKRPILTLVIATGVGCLLGMFLKGNSKNSR